MRTRAEAAALIQEQMHGPEQGSQRILPEVQKGDSWHYGHQELKQLLDYIYEGPPSSPAEEIGVQKWIREVQAARKT